MAHRFIPHPLAVAAALLCTLGAQAAETITITGRSESGNSSVSGFGDTPLSRLPLQAASFGPSRLADANVERIGDLTRLDASVGDAYNAPGYWSMIAVRGYTLDNRFNYRRDGLPINAETAIALENKDRLELLKGTSGIQAGTSAPGGLVNLLVKRPVTRQRSATVDWQQSGTLGLAVDIGDRSGPDGAIGWRVNAAYQHLDPLVRDTQGHRSLLALATDWRLGADTLLEAEIEASRQQQPSVAGFSLRGNTVPAAGDIDPRLNLNHQPWNQPVVMNGDTASLRWQQRLNDDWRLKAHAMAQRLKSDDRTAFPYGVYDSNYACSDWCDRFAPDGTFTYWQYVSDNERRSSDALDLSASGRLLTGAVEHRLETGVLFTRYRGRFQDQIFDIAGTGRDDGSLQTPPSPGFPDANTNRDERSTELYLRDAMKLGPWSLWAGLRHSRLHRQSERTSVDSDGSLRAIDVKQGETLPWLAVSQQIDEHLFWYASWGQGLETDAAPNRPNYVNAGQPLPALKSRQIEIGLKRAGETFDAALTLFDIDRPKTADLCDDVTGSCLRAIDGSARHRGLEGQLAARVGAWEGQLGAMLLDAERRGSSQAGVNGLRPENVPKATLRAGLAYRVPALQGLVLQSALVAEGNRVVLPYDESVRIPGWARLDLGLRWTQALAGSEVTWRAGVDNATDHRAWKESPYQFGHAYLYPLAPRTWRASAQVGF